MTMELFKFGVVMIVVMLGFVMAFFTLFMDDDTFGQTFLSLFKAMLGEVGLFDEFGEHIRGRMATALLTMYFVIMNIMLLNLLIAVLSTSHSKVEENADLEYKVSKARMIQHYEMMVDKDMLSAPFCLLQIGLSYTLGKDATQAFGQAVFWLVLGPVAVVVGVLLWILSAFYTPYTRFFFFRFSCGTIAFLALRWLLIVLWCGLVAPLCLIVIWLWAPLRPALICLNGFCPRKRVDQESNEVARSSSPSTDVQEASYGFKEQSHSFNVNEMLINVWI